MLSGQLIQIIYQLIQIVYQLNTASIYAATQLTDCPANYLSFSLLILSIAVPHYYLFFLSFYLDEISL